MYFKRACIAVATCFIVSLEPIFCANATFLDGQGVQNGPGRPRFRKKDQRKGYFSLAAIFQPYEKVMDVSGLGFTSEQLTALGFKPGDSTSFVPTGGLAIGFGYVPSKAQFLRFHADLIFMGTYAKILGNVIYPPGSGHTTYTNNSLVTIPIVINAQLFFQFVPKMYPFTIYAGGGIGLEYQANIVNGTPQSDPTQSSTSSSSTQTIFNSAKNFAVMFVGSVGFTVDITQGLSVDIRASCFVIMMPFGLNQNRFTVFEIAPQLYGGILFKI